MTSDNGVQALSRAFALLEAIEDVGGDAGVTQLSTRTGIPAPTIHRILYTLVDAGYVRRLPGRRYGLGPGLVRMGESASRLIARWARPILEGIEAEVMETANLAVLDGDQAAYVAQVPSRHQMRMFTEAGRRVPLHSTGVGKALLAQLPDPDVRAIVGRTGLPGFTRTTATTEDDLFDRLRVIRSRGYAVDDGEQEVGVRCIAVAVHEVGPPTAVSVSGPSSRVTTEMTASLGAMLTRASVHLRRAFHATADSR